MNYQEHPAKADMPLMDSEFHHQSSKEDLGETELSHPGRFLGSGSAKFDLRRPTWKNLRHGLEKGPQNNTAEDSKYYLVKGLELPLRRRQVISHSRKDSENEFSRSKGRT